ELLADHEIIFSEGAATESMYLGQQRLGTLTAPQQAEIAAGFGVAQPTGIAHRPVRPFARKAAAVRTLLERHRRNGKALQPAPAAMPGSRHGMTAQNGHFTENDMDI